MDIKQAWKSSVINNTTELSFVEFKKQNENTVELKLTHNEFVVMNAILGVIDFNQIKEIHQKICSRVNNNLYDNIDVYKVRKEFSALEPKAVKCILSVVSDKADKFL